MKMFPEYVQCWLAFLLSLDTIRNLNFHVLLLSCRLEEKRKEKRERKKAAKKELQAKKLEARRKEAEHLSEDEINRRREESRLRLEQRKRQKIEQKQKLEKSLVQGQRILVDLDFAHLMTATEIKSIVQQLLFCYGVNVRASVPCHLMFSSIDGAIKEAIDRQIPSFDAWKVTQSPLPYMQLLQEDKQDIVYLSADSPNEIQELDPKKVYIVGGLVDRNRHKGVCLKKAEEQGIQTARLPIGQYIQLSSSQVMCTNHAVEMLIKWCEIKDWEKAFKSVVPDRKRRQVDDK
jgi:tRNA (guanine9-N1)-methyltransferase